MVWFIYDIMVSSSAKVSVARRLTLYPWVAGSRTAASDMLNSFADEENERRDDDGNEKDEEEEEVDGASLYSCSHLRRAGGRIGTADRLVIIDILVRGTGCIRSTEAMVVVRDHEQRRWQTAKSLLGEMVVVVRRGAIRDCGCQSLPSEPTRPDCDGVYP